MQNRKSRVEGNFHPFFYGIGKQIEIKAFGAERVGLHMEA